MIDRQNKAATISQQPAATAADSRARRTMKIRDRGGGGPPISSSSSSSILSVAHHQQAPTPQRRPTITGARLKRAIEEPNFATVIYSSSTQRQYGDCRLLLYGVSFCRKKQKKSSPKMKEAALLGLVALFAAAVLFPGAGQSAREMNRVLQ